MHRLVRAVRTRLRRWWFGSLRELGPLGIARMGHHLSYGTDGWGRYWLPDSIQGCLITAWNAWACRRWGHAWVPDLDGGPLDAPITRELCSACGVQRVAPIPWRAAPTADPHRWLLERDDRGLH